MLRILGIGLVVAAGITPLAASAQAADNVLVVYGNDKCPTNANGEEITVCARMPEGERYRIPKDLREGGKYADRQSWSVTSPSLLAAGATGPGSCSASGIDSWTGCAQKEYSGWRAAKRADQAQSAAAYDIAHHDQPAVVVAP